MAARVTTFRESVAAFHGRKLGMPTEPAVWICVPAADAVVLGSTQPLDDVDADACAANGLAIVRRHSGGGAVLVDAASIWVDLVVPAGAAGWHDDIGRAAVWAGTCWRDALSELRPGLGRSLVVHDGPMQHTAWSRRVCFDGVGPGEVLLDGRKLVGLSQRRTRHGARFQTMCSARPDQARLAGVLAAPAPAPGELAEPAAMPVGDEPTERVAARLGALLAARIAG